MRARLAQGEVARPALAAAPLAYERRGLVWEALCTVWPSHNAAAPSMPSNAVVANAYAVV